MQIAVLATWLLQHIGRRPETRTLIGGFGDRSPTIERTPYIIWWAEKDSNLRCLPRGWRIYSPLVSPLTTSTHIWSEPDASNPLRHSPQTFAAILLKRQGCDPLTLVRARAIILTTDASSEAEKFDHTPLLRLVRLTCYQPSDFTKLHQRSSQFMRVEE